MQEIRIRKEDSGQRLDKFLRRYLPGAGTGFLYKMLRRKNILLEGKKATGKELLQEGDIVRIFFSDETIKTFQARPETFYRQGTPALRPESVLYADSQILLVNKPAGILTQKAEKKDVSLVEMTQTWLLKNGMRTEEDSFFYKPGPANRLDRNTSGLVVIPLTLAAAQQVSDMFRERTVHKRYLALTAGVYTGPRTQKAWCLRDPVTRKTQILFRDTEGADRIETICEPLITSACRTLLKVTLVTGKTHQIRSHLQACGFPVIGDPKYGSFPEGFRSSLRKDFDTAPASPLRRQFLHAWQLEFPICSGPVEQVSGRLFTAPLPDDLRAELAACGMPWHDNNETDNTGRNTV